APRATVNGSEERLTLADQRRLIDRWVVQIPAHADLQVVRGDALEGGRVDDGVDAVEGAQIAGQAVAHVEIAVSQFDGEVRRDLVSDTGVQRPGEVPLGDVIAEGNAGRGRVDVGEVVDRDPRTADAGADERRHAPPGAEIDIGVAENDPFRLRGVI